MYKLSKSRVITILAICFIGVFFAIPNLIGNSSALPSWWQPVNLGLDLQGGSNLLLEVKLDDVLKERMSSIEDSARQILRENRIRYKSQMKTALKFPLKMPAREPKQPTCSVKLTTESLRKKMPREILSSLTAKLL